MSQGESQEDNSEEECSKRVDKMGKNEIKNKL
jgi:hypothetical protein